MLTIVIVAVSTTTYCWATVFVVVLVASGVADQIAAVAGIDGLASRSRNTVPERVTWMNGEGGPPATRNVPGACATRDEPVSANENGVVPAVPVVPEKNVNVVLIGSLGFSSPDWSAVPGVAVPEMSSSFAPAVFVSNRTYWVPPSLTIRSRQIG